MSIALAQTVVKTTQRAQFPINGAPLLAVFHALAQVLNSQVPSEKRSKYNLAPTTVLSSPATATVELPIQELCFGLRILAVVLGSAATAGAIVVVSGGRRGRETSSSPPPPPAPGLKNTGPMEGLDPQVDPDDDDEPPGDPPPPNPIDDDPTVVPPVRGIPSVVILVLILICAGLLFGIWKSFSNENELFPTCVYDFIRELITLNHGLQGWLRRWVIAPTRGIWPLPISPGLASEPGDLLEICIGGFMALVMCIAAGSFWSKVHTHTAVPESPRMGCHRPANGEVDVTSTSTTRCYDAWAGGGNSDAGELFDTYGGSVTLEEISQLPSNRLQSETIELNTPTQMLHKGPAFWAPARERCPLMIKVPLTKSQRRRKRRTKIYAASEFGEPVAGKYTMNDPFTTGPSFNTSEWVGAECKEGIVFKTENLMRPNPPRSNLNPAALVFKLQKSRPPQ